MSFEGAYETGSVTTFSGATGLLQALLDFVLGTEVAAEVLATGANVNTTLANFPVAKGRIVVDYTISAVAYEGTDDGAGNITGTNITSGTIDYSTGDIVITFASAPTGDVTCDYLYGEPGQDWRVLENRNTRDSSSPAGEPFGSSCKEVILSHTGNSGQEFVCIGIREWTYPAGNAAGWDLNGYTWFNDDMEWNANNVDHGYTTYDATWEHWSKMPTMPLIDDSMTYWFFSNRQRIVVIAKVSSQYEQCYLGFGRRFGNPSDYPYPIMVDGSYYGNFNYASQNDGHRGIIDMFMSDSDYKFMHYSPGGNWWGGSTQYQFTLPRIQPRTNFSDNGTIGPTTTGRVLMLPTYICQRNSDECYCDLDGVYTVVATGIQAEDTIKKAGVEAICFPNIWRTSYYDYVAIDAQTYTTTTSTTSTTTTTTT